MKKIFFLVVALLAPVVIYLFLQSFGDNQYELPVLYNEEVPVLEGCEGVIAPYKLPGGVYEGVQHKAILIDTRLGEVDRKFINNELARVRQYFGGSPFHYILMSVDIDAGVLDGDNGGLDLEEYARCVLRYEENNSFITLVDRQGRIRSYFDTSKKQDFDRLITEIEILNKFE
ncbi:MAG: hypothetical protein RIF33_26210 [Cyclobacteriaceae bacterium]